MESKSEPGGGSASSSVQLRRLCRHLLGPEVSEEVLSSHFRSALQLLSSSSTGQEETRANEFVVAEKIKKSLIRDGRDRETATFTELHLRLQKSSIVKNREAILQLFHNLSERTQRSVPKKIPPFAASNTAVSVSTTNGTVESGGVTVATSDSGDNLTNGGKHYLSQVIPAPFRTRPTCFNGNLSPASGDTRPPLPPKPRNVQSPRHPSKAKAFLHLPPEAESEEGKASEVELLRELLYVFQGIQGTILVKDAFSGFVIARDKQDLYSPSVVHLALRLAELGWLYNTISSFCENASAHQDLGLVGHSLVSALREELTDYYRLLSLLEDQLKTKGEEGMAMTLHKLSVYSLEPMARLKILAAIVEKCGKNNQRGGSLLSTVYGFLHHGNKSLANTVHKLLTAMTKPIYATLVRWLLDGTLEDPHGEFFVASDPQVKDEARLWHDKYSIRRSMIPKFVKLAWVKKILVTGKSINFLRSVCGGDASPTLGSRENLRRTLLEGDCGPANLFEDPHDNKLHHAIQQCYTQTSALVLDTLFKKYKLVDHFSAMRKYLLLGQGDLIRYLLELLDEELSAPAATLYPHNLAGILETAIRATNAQFEEPDILERLDVRLLDVQPGDSGWDVFSLDYKVAGPISAVFGRRTLTRYLMLFNSLWRAKRMEWILARLWTRQTSLAKIALRTVPELQTILHTANLLSSEMIHFVHQMAYYTAFEVMECSWDELIQQLHSAENLDEVIEAHEQFLNSVVRRALLGENSRELLTQMRAIYDRIVEFDAIQLRLYAAGMAELEARRAHETQIAARSRKGQYGITQEVEDADLQRRHTFAVETMPKLETQLKIVSQSYQDMVRTFLLQLTCSQDQSLQCLSFRLDFNEHYKRKDARLGTPLTFQHRRLSIRGEKASSSSNQN